MHIDIQTNTETDCRTPCSEKRWNRSRCRWGCEFWGSKPSTYWVEPRYPTGKDTFGEVTKSYLDMSIPARSRYCQPYSLGGSNDALSGYQSTAAGFWFCALYHRCPLLSVFTPHRYAQHKMQPIVAVVAWSVCVSVCWSRVISCWACLIWYCRWLWPIIRCHYYYFLSPVLNSQGMKKLRYAIQKVQKNHAGMNLTPRRPSENCHVAFYAELLLLLLLLFLNPR